MHTMVGFDVAKETVVGAVIDEHYLLVVPPTLIVNGDEAVKQWLEAQQTRFHEISVCCESTSYYHYALVRACTALGVLCYVLNPIVTRQATKATIRGKKTDDCDAILVAKLGLRGGGVLTTNTSIQNDAKVLLRTSDKLQSAAQGMRLMHQALTERYVSLPPSIQRRYSTCTARLDELTELFRDTATLRLSAGVMKLLMTIPGVGAKTAAILAAEIGDISLFSSAEKLAAYMGLDPRVRQSGTSLHRNTRLTKRGSPSLRRAVFMAANVTRQHDPEVGAYYEKKRAEGRTHTEAMMPTTRKLLARIYAVWSKQRPYEKRA